MITACFPFILTLQKQLPCSSLLQWQLRSRLCFAVHFLSWNGKDALFLMPCLLVVHTVLEALSEYEIFSWREENIKKWELKVRSKCIQNVLMEVVNLPINASNFCSCTRESIFWRHSKKRQVNDLAWSIQKEQYGVFKESFKSYAAYLLKIAGLQKRESMVSTPAQTDCSTPPFLCIISWFFFRLTVVGQYFFSHHCIVLLQLWQDGQKIQETFCLLFLC